MSSIFICLEIKVKIALIKKWLDRISNAGTYICQKEIDKRRVRLINRISLMITFCSLLYTLPLLYLKNYGMALSLIPFATLLSLPISLNHYGLNRLSGIWSIICLTIGIFFYSSLLGTQMQIQMAYFPAMILPLTFFHHANAKAILSSIMFQFILLSGHYLWAYQLALPSIASPVFFEVVGLCSLLGSFLLTAFCVSALQRDSAQAEDDLEEMIEQKHRLLGTVCHDIANPLTIAGVSIGVIQKELKLNQQASENHAKMIKFSDKTCRAIEVTTSIIDNVRLLEANHQNKNVIQIETVTMKDIIPGISFLFQEKLETKNIELVYTDHIKIGSGIAAEKHSLINNVFNNIISNAIKFSYQGSKISFTATTIGGRVIVKIKDDGIGIPKDVLNVLFKSNESTTRKGTNGEKGTGFGMPLVLSFLEKYGATINIESNSIEEHPENHGTVIILSFRQRKIKKKQTDHGQQKRDLKRA